MGFFDRQSQELEKRGLDPARCRRVSISPSDSRCCMPGSSRISTLPPGTSPSTAWWRPEQQWTLEEFKALPSVELTTDIHCVTKWSKFDTEWRGVPTTEVVKLVEPSPAATHVVVRAEHGFTANLPLEDFLARGQPVRLRVRRRGTRARPRLAGAAGGATPLLLEIGQVDAGLHPPRPRRARLLGTKRLPHVRRPVPRTALLGRLTSRRRGRGPAFDLPPRSGVTLGTPCTPRTRRGVHR